MRIKIVFEYDGSEFFGYQRQLLGNSVQQTLEEALKKTFGNCIAIVASGRTDSGVNAINAVAHFDVESTTIPPEKICYAINFHLPESIRIKSSCMVSDDFHARCNAKGKTYLYRMYQSDFLSPTRRRTHTRVDKNLDLEKMREQMQYLLGEHNFAGFMTTGSSVKTTIRTITSVSLDIVGDDELHFYISGSGFLYNMVRIIVGTLLAIGQGKDFSINEAIKTVDRTKAGETAPAEGLCLYFVEY